MLFILIVGDQEESQQLLRITKVKQVECHGHLLAYYKEEVILVIEEEMNLVVNPKADRVEEQIVEVEERGKMIDHTSNNDVPLHSIP